MKHVPPWLNHIIGRSRRQALVLDTSLFVNPDARKGLGGDCNEAVRRFLAVAKEAGVRLFMPTSIYRELSHFTEDERILRLIKNEICVRSPDLHHLKVPAAIFHSFIRDVRHRVNKGLRIAEEAIRSENIPDNIRRIRELYRNALRTGIIDSAEDLDVVLLAKEVGAAVMSADEGIAKMADELGLEVLDTEGFLARYGPRPSSS